jgi:hypothetical protein
MRRVLVGEGDETHRPREATALEEPREREQDGDAAGVVVAARRAANCVVMRTQYDLAVASFAANDAFEV